MFSDGAASLDEVANRTWFEEPPYHRLPSQTPALNALLRKLLSKDQQIRYNAPLALNDAWFSQPPGEDEMAVGVPLDVGVRQRLVSPHRVQPPVPPSPRIVQIAPPAAASPCPVGPTPASPNVVMMGQAQPVAGFR